MIENDRDRLLVGVGIALIIHAILVVVLAIVGLNTPPFPENEPVFVTLPDYESPAEDEQVIEPPEPVEPPAPPEEIAVPVEVDSPEPDSPQPEPIRAQPETEPEPVLEPRTEPTPEIRRDPVAPAPPDSTGTDAPPGSFSTEDLPWLQDDDSTDRAPERSSDDLFAIRESDDVDQDLPSWVVEGEFSLQPESTLEEDAQTALDEKRESVPGFSERLSELIRSLENPPSSTSGTESGTSGGGEDGPESATTALPGGSVIEWVGSGGRRLIGQPALPRLTASDFGGQVPARISYLIVFEVNAEGLVVPGSLILRQSSGYTQADQKVRASISTWRFESAPGAPPVTAIATLHITRDDIR